MISLQERFFPTSTCFGCGPANANGLRLRSFADSSTGVTSTLAHFTTTTTHDNGLGCVNGGIIATLLDCHSAGSALLQAELLEWTTAEGAAYPCVTAGLELRYLRPTPLCEELDLRAEVAEYTSDQITVLSTISQADKIRAEALVIWRRWKPRVTAADAS